MRAPGNRRLHCLRATFLFSAALCVLPLAATQTGFSASVAELCNASFRITDKTSSGTCFLVSPPAGSSCPTNTVFLVTCAHTLDGMPGKQCFLIMRKQTNGTYERQEFPLEIRSGDKALWTKHGSADLAVMKVTLPCDLTWTTSSFDRLAREEDFHSRISLGAVGRVILAEISQWIGGRIARIISESIGRRP